MEFECSECGKMDENIDQNVFKVRGRIEDSMMDDEEKEIENDDIIYYYFNESSEEKIRGSQDVGGKARSLCRKCIENSIEDTFKKGDPHYCDGVYLTYNNNLNNANDNIKHCHGTYVANRKLRVKFKIENADGLIKTFKTGGVVKTNEGIKNYAKTELIFLNMNRNSKLVQYLGIEEYKNNKWRSKKVIRNNA